MRILISGQSYEVPVALQEKLLADVLAEGTKDYHNKLDKKWRVIAMAPARLILQAIESHAVKQSDPDAARAAIRPPKGADPVLHLGFVFSRILLGAMKHVTIHIDTDGQRSVSALNVVIESAGEAGRLVDFDRSQGQRQIDGAQIP